MAPFSSHATLGGWTGGGGGGAGEIYAVERLPKGPHSGVHCEVAEHAKEVLKSEEKMLKRLVTMEPGSACDPKSLSQKTYAKPAS